MQALYRIIPQYYIIYTYSIYDNSHTIAEHSSAVGHVLLLSKCKLDIRISQSKHTLIMDGTYYNLHRIYLSDIPIICILFNHQFFFVCSQRKIDDRIV